MGKQAIGVGAHNSLELVYGHRNLTTTVSEEIYNTDSLPTGTQCIVAIGVFEGLNKEDAIVLNKGSVERGMFQ